MRKHMVVKELKGLTSNQLYQYSNVQKKNLDFEINCFIMCQKKKRRKEVRCHLLQQFVNFRKK